MRVKMVCRMVSKHILAGVVLASLIAPGIAHEHATGVVRERMDMMEAMAKRIKSMAERIKTRRDLAAIKSDAEALQTLAPHMVHLFPPGSSDPPTDAKPAIWQNWSDFEAKARAFEAASSALANTDPSDLNALSMQIRALGRTCGDCHERYRAKR
jgi:cytochrome c556